MFSSEEKSCQKVLNNLTNLRDKIYAELIKIEDEIKKSDTTTSYGETLKRPYLYAKEELFQDLNIINQVLIRIENPKKLVEEKKATKSFEMSFFMIHIDLLKKNLDCTKLAYSIDKTTENILKQTKKITQKAKSLIDELKKFGNQHIIINYPKNDYAVALYLKSKNIEQKLALSN